MVADERRHSNEAFAWDLTKIFGVPIFGVRFQLQRRIFGVRYSGSDSNCSECFRRLNSCPPARQSPNPTSLQRRRYWAAEAYLLKAAPLLRCRAIALRN